MTRRVLITGGNGFIGSSLTKSLVSRGDFDVVATYRENRERLPEEDSEILHCVHLDISRRAEVESVFSEYDFDAVIHTAAVVRGGNDVESMLISIDQIVLGTANLLAESRRRGCKLFVFCSSVSVYGDILVSGDSPENPIQSISEDIWPRPNAYYGWSKLSAEELLRVSAESGSMTGISLRLAGTHGPGRKSGALYHMMSNALRGQPLVVAEPKSRFRFLFLEDAIESIIGCLLNWPKENYRCYNVASKRIFTLPELADQIIAYTGSNSHLDIQDSGRIRSQVWSIDRICQETNFKPKPLNYHIMKMHEYVRLSESD